LAIICFGIAEKPSGLRRVAYDGECALLRLKL